MAEIKLPSNSNASKETSKKDVSNETREKKFSKVTTGKVTIKKKTGIEKFAETFLAEDIHNVMNTIKNEMLIPAAKNLAVNIINSAISMMVYGKDARPPYSYNNYYQSQQNVSRTSYSSYYTRSQQPYAQTPDPQNGYSSGPNITFSVRLDAEEVLEQMRGSIMQFGKVSVADYYDLVGVTTDYTDYSYGWYDLSTASIRAINGGFIIVFPKAIPLGR